MKKLFSVALITLLIFSNFGISVAGTITPTPSNPTEGQDITVVIESVTNKANTATITWIVKIGDETKTIIQENVTKADSKYVSSITLFDVKEGEIKVDAQIKVVYGQSTILEDSEEITIYVSEATQIFDTKAPVINTPNSISVEATGPHGAVVEFVLSALDEIDGEVSVESTFNSGDMFPIGITNIVLKAVDKSGNEAYDSFTVSVVDTTSPVLTVPSDMTVEATGPNGATVNFDVSAVDLVDEDVFVEAVPGSGSLFPLGETIVDVKATDDSGNSDEKSFKVNVVDTTDPELTSISDITVYSLNDNGAPANFEAFAEDLVDGQVDVIYSHTSGSMFKLGTTVVNYSASDSRGNKVEKSFKVTVKYNFSGFFKPVEMGSDVVNVVKAGSAVPLKFSLSGYQGMSVFVPGYPMAITGVYQPDMDFEVMPTIETAGKSGLSYDALTDQYTYVWKTDKAWAGNSKILVVKFSDGTVQTVNFKFNK
jgi:hypothetical protein